MKTRFTTTALALLALGWAAQASAQVTFYEHENFEGRSFTTDRQVYNFERRGFADRASSVVVSGSRWEVCDDVGFSGRCMVLRRGNYPSLSAMGLNDRIMSVRAVRSDARLEDDRYAPVPLVDSDYRRRTNERLFQADVTSVRAVLATPERRCWIERQEVRDDNRVPATIAGAVIGGILGHQVGGGSGRDLATVGGAVAGAAVGNRAARGSGSDTNVQRCADANAGRLDHYDVTYRFRGQEHHVQMTAPPGPTVTVNRNGEPRAA